MKPKKEELMKELLEEHPTMLDDDQYFIRLGEHFNYEPNPKSIFAVNPAGYLYTT